MNETGSTAAILDLIFNDCPDRYVNNPDGTYKHRLEPNRVRVLDARVSVYGDNYGDAAGSISPDLIEAVNHMPKQYNNFTRADLLAALTEIGTLTVTRSDGTTHPMGQNMQIDFGREGSPVIYMRCSKSEVAAIKKVMTRLCKPDEMTYNQSTCELRCWYD